MYKKIHIASYDDYLKKENYHRDCAVKNNQDMASYDKMLSDKARNRQEVLLKFPYSVVLQGVYPEHDFVDRWCWQNFGPRNGPCTDGVHSEYTGCPIVLATEYVSKYSWKDKDGKEHSGEEICYRDVERHSHEGTWQSIWLIKTGYDYGLGEYCFSSEEDRDRFLAAVPTFNLGEKYVKEKEDE